MCKYFFSTFVYFYFLSDDGRIIPANSDVTMSLNITFRDPKYFADTEIFLPERFAAENMEESKMNPFAYIPFSAGMRNCTNYEWLKWINFYPYFISVFYPIISVGQIFALLEIKAAVSKVLRHFELSPAGEDPDVVIVLVTRSKNVIQLGLRPRIL